METLYDEVKHGLVAGYAPCIPLTDMTAKVTSFLAQSAFDERAEFKTIRHPDMTHYVFLDNGRLLDTLDVGNAVKVTEVDLRAIWCLLWIRNNFFKEV